jgi:hypothetical protein
MTSQERIQYIFESSRRSAPAWIEKGKGLLLAAETLNTELLQLCNKYLPSIPGNIEPKFIGLMDGVMLLLGLAIENVIKGFIVANKPDFESISSLNRYKFNSSGGHGIKEMVVFNIKDLIQIEKDLLERLEVTIIWAGKYNSPRKINCNFKNIDSIHPSFREKDFYNCSILFKKIESLTMAKWDQNENLVWNWCDKYESLNNK